MTCTTFGRISTITRRLAAHRRRGAGAASLSAVTVVALVLSACGGDDDSASTTSNTVAVTVAPTTTGAPAATTTVAATTTTTIALVTEGATLIVANASNINGAAGRMSDALAVAGFSTGTATNSSEGQLETTKIYYDPENANAEAVANSVRQALGGGAIEILEMGTPAPVETGEVGDASIVVAIGNDVSDKSLAELQGLVAPAATDDTTPDDTTPDDTTADTSG